MFETLNNVGGIVQPFGLRQEQGKHPPQGCWNKHETMCWPCLITTSSSSKNVVDLVLVNWKQPESTKNGPK